MHCRLVLQGYRPANIVIKISIQFSSWICMKYIDGNQSNPGKHQTISFCVRLQVECPTIEELYFPSVKKCKIANKSELPSANKCMLPVGPCPPVSEVRHFIIWNSSKVAKIWSKLEKKKKRKFGESLTIAKVGVKIVTWKWIKTFSILSKKCVWTQVL